MNYLQNSVPPPSMLNWEREWLLPHHPQDEGCMHRVIAEARGRWGGVVSLPKASW